MLKKIFIIALLVLLATASLFSLDCVIEERSDTPFNLNLVLDTSIIATSAGLNGAVFYFDKVCGLNQPDFDGNIFDPHQVNSFDRLLMHPYSAAMDDLGSYTSIASTLTPLVLLAAPSDQWLTIGMMYAETMTLAYGIKELGKLCTHRARPFMYYEGYPSEAVDDHDWNKSFPSGHTTLAFAGSTFTSYVFNKYFPESKWKIPVIGASYFFAFSSASCRLASGDHFLTDVIFGAVAGTACGFIVPWMHSQIFKKEISEDKGTVNFSVMPRPTGLIVSLQY